MRVRVERTDTKKLIMDFTLEGVVANFTFNLDDMMTPDRGDYNI